MPPEAPMLLETELAALLGLERTILTDARVSVLEAGDIVRSKAGISYTPEAVLKVCAHLHITPPAELLPEKKEPAGAQVVPAIVVRLARSNTRMIYARRFGPLEKDAAPELGVRVRQAAMFIPGQQIRVLINGGVAVLYGPQPRSRGRNARPHFRS